QIEGEIARLRSERVGIVQERARAEMDEIAHTRTIPGMARVDALLDEAQSVLADVKRAKAEQATIAAAAGLEEPAKRFNLNYVDIALRWKLDGFVRGVRQHWAREVTLEQFESMRQGLTPPLETETDNAA